MATKKISELTSLSVLGGDEILETSKNGAGSYQVTPKVLLNAIGQLDTAASIQSTDLLSLYRPGDAKSYKGAASNFLTASTSGLAANDILQYNGTAWANSTPRSFKELFDDFIHPVDMTYASIQAALTTIRDQGVAAVGGTPTGKKGIALTVPGEYTYDDAFILSILQTAYPDYSRMIPKLHIYVGPGVIMKMNPATSFSVFSGWFFVGVEHVTFEVHGELWGDIDVDRTAPLAFNGKDIVRIYDALSVDFYGSGWLRRCNGAGIRVICRDENPLWSAGVAPVDIFRCSIKQENVAQPWTTNNSDDAVGCVRNVISTGEYWLDCGSGPKFTARTANAEGFSGLSKLYMRNAINVNPRLNGLNLQDGVFYDVELHVEAGADSEGTLIENVINTANTLDSSNGEFHRMVVTYDNRAGSAMRGVLFTTDAGLAADKLKPIPGVYLDQKTWGLTGKCLSLNGEFVNGHFILQNFDYRGTESAVTYDALARNATVHNNKFEIYGDYTGDNGVGNPGDSGNVAGVDHNPVIFAVTRDSNTTGVLNGLDVSFNGIKTTNWLRNGSVQGTGAEFIKNLRVTATDNYLDNAAGLFFCGSTGDLVNPVFEDWRNVKNSRASGTGLSVAGVRGGVARNLDIEASSSVLSVSSASRGFEIDHDSVQLVDMDTGLEVAPTDSQGPVFLSATRSAAVCTITITTANGADGATALTVPTNARRLFQAFVAGSEVAISSIASAAHNTIAVTLAADPGAPATIVAHHKRRFSALNGGQGERSDRITDNNKVALKYGSVVTAS